VKVIARIEGKGLVLDDLRRLFRETGGWNGQCAVDVNKYGDGQAYVMVVETVNEREPSE
jgi:hypothetical protein